MLRITADTNILVSAVIAEGNEYRLLRLAGEGKVKLVLSLAILKELRDVLSRSKFGFSGEQQESIIHHIVSICELVVPQRKVSVIADDEDNRILECALAGKADYIVSGDKHLLNLKTFQEIPIMTTREFLKVIKRQ